MALRRLLAGLIDILILSIVPLAALQTYKVGVIGVTFLVFPVLVTLYFAAFHRFKHQTLGKMATGLAVHGDGCILCRELRKCAVLFLVLALFVVQNLNIIGQPSAGTMQGLLFFHDYIRPVLWLVVIAFTFFPITTIAFGKAPHWDRATGFDVVRL